MTSADRSVASHCGRSVDLVYPMREDVPAHIPPELVYHYDVFQPGPPGADIFEELFKLKRRAPPIFWTPYNGGHWYTPDGVLARQVLADNVHFSSQMLMLPAENNPPKGQGFTPIHLDPPEHGMYRRLLQMALSRKTVVDMMPHMRKFTIDLIERLKPEGRCDFIAEVAYALPTQVFMYLVDLPPQYQDGLTWRVAALHDAASDKAKLFAEIGDLLRPFVNERIANPGDDVLSWLSTQEIEGQPVTEERLHSMTTLLLIAGLGTIADTFGCIFRHLADNPRASPLDPRESEQDERRRRGAAAALPGDSRRHRQALRRGCRDRRGDSQGRRADARRAADDELRRADLRRPAGDRFRSRDHRQRHLRPWPASLYRRRAQPGAAQHADRGMARPHSEFHVSPTEPDEPEAAVNVCYERLIFEWSTA